MSCSRSNKKLPFCQTWWWHLGTFKRSMRFSNWHVADLVGNCWWSRSSIVALGEDGRLGNKAFYRAPEVDILASMELMRISLFGVRLATVRWIRWHAMCKMWHTQNGLTGWPWIWRNHESIAAPLFGIKDVVGTGVFLNLRVYAD